MPAANAGVLAVHPAYAGTAAGLAAAVSIGGGALIISVGGLFVSGPHAVTALLAVMLFTATLALLAAISASFASRGL